MKFLLVVLLCLLFFGRSNAQIITTFAGNGLIGNDGDGGQASAASMYIPSGGCFDNAGNFYFVVGVGHRVRKISTTGIISTIAGTGMAGFDGDGVLATNAKLNMPSDVVVDTSGNVYISDSYNYRIRKVEAGTGIISTIAGNGTSGFSGDGGPATAAQIHSGGYLALDKNGNLFFSDLLNYRIRKIALSAGSIQTIAGTGTAPISGMGGAPTGASFRPAGLCFDKAGNLFVADNFNFVVYKIDLENNLISIFAGVPGANVYNGEGINALAAQFHPNYIAMDKCDQLYINDNNNNRIRKINTDGLISTVAGNGSQGFSGDGGLAINAQLYWPVGITLSSEGNLYISDSYNYRIRKVMFDPCLLITDVIMERAKETFTISPNPASSTLTLESSEEIKSVTITNSIGRLIYTRQYTHHQKVEIDIEHLPPGLYILRINGTHIKRLTKQ